MDIQQLKRLRKISGKLSMNRLRNPTRFPMLSPHQRWWLRSLPRPPRKPRSRQPRGEKGGESEDHFRHERTKFLVGHWTIRIRKSQSCASRSKLEVVSLEVSSGVAQPLRSPKKTFAVSAFVSRTLQLPFWRSFDPHIPVRCISEIKKTLR